MCKDSGSEGERSISLIGERYTRMNMTIWKSKAESRTLSEQLSVCCVLLLRRKNLCKTGSSSETDDAGIPRCTNGTGGLADFLLVSSNKQVDRAPR